MAPILFDGFYFRRLVIAVHPDKNSHAQAGEACAKLQQVDLVIFIIVITFVVIISKFVVIITIIFVEIIIFVVIAIFVIITVIVITAIFVNIINVIIDISGL